MGFRVAVASSDGKFINQHFGHAQQFLIFEMNQEQEEEFQFVELRKSKPVCSHQSHDEAGLQAAIERLIDCQAVVASQIGPGAKGLLEINGIQAYSVVDFIAPALQRIAAFCRRQPESFRNINSGFGVREEK